MAKQQSLKIPGAHLHQAAALAGYRIVSPRDSSEIWITEPVSTGCKQAMLFAFLHSSQMGYPFPGIYLRGIDPRR